jgi:hypothetical protein
VSDGVEVPVSSGKMFGAAIVIAPAIIVTVSWRHPALRVGWVTCDLVSGRDRVSAIDRRAALDGRAAVDVRIADAGGRRGGSTHTWSVRASLDLREMTLQPTSSR